MPAYFGDVNFRSSGFERFLLESGQLVAALADVATDGDHFALIVFLEPGNDDRRVEAAGIS